MTFKVKDIVSSLKNLKSKKDKEIEKLKNENDLSEEGLSKRLKNRAKRTVKLITAWILSQLTAALILILSMSSIMVILMFIIISTLGFIGGILTTMKDVDMIGGGRGSHQAPGERYIWNEQDLNLLSSEYLRNIYRQAWFISNAKELTGSNLYTTEMLGVCNFESGSKFYSLYDERQVNVGGKTVGAESLSIAEYASGETGSGNSNYQSIYQQYVQYDGVGFGRQLKDRMTQYNVTLADIYGDMKHADSLKTNVMGTFEQGIVNSWAGGDVNYSNYNLGAVIFFVVTTFEIYNNHANGDTMVTKDSTSRNHNFAIGYKKALKRYGLEDSDEMRAYVSSCFQYGIHAGGPWGSMSDQEYLDYRDACADYFVFLYVNYPDIELLDSFKTEKGIFSLNVPNLRASAMGDEYAAFDKVWSYKNMPTVKNSVLQQNGQQLTVSLMEAWQTYNAKTGYDNLTQSYRNTCLNSAFITKQNTYGIACCPIMMAIGEAKLDVIFNELGKDWVLDRSTGYVCNPASMSTGGGYGESGDYGTVAADGGWTPPSGHYKYKKTFEEGKITINGTQVSNYRDDSWFVTLDLSEWSQPLSPETSDPGGGFHLSSRYGYRSWNNYDFHGGIDLAYNNSYGDISDWRKYYPVYAMHDGEVSQCVKDTTTVSGAGRTFAYKVVYKRNGESVTRYITYMHLSEIDSNLSEGSKIKKGQLIGYMGGSGSGSETCYACHLHIQIGTSPKANRQMGIVDIETELPFVTLYNGYDAFFENPNNYSGYLIQAPATNIGANDKDPQKREHL